VNLCRNLLALAVGLPVLAAAADADMLRLVDPRASVVLEINIAKIAASPIGASLGDAMRQGIATQVKSELWKSKSQFQEGFVALTSFDWSHEVQDVLISSGADKQSPTLIIVRSSLDAARIQALKGFSGAISDFEGVPILESAQPGNGLVAFLDNSILLIGEAKDVKAAIHNRNQPKALPASLTAKIARYNGYDIWMFAVGPKSPAPSSSPAAVPPAAAVMTQFLVVGYFQCLRNPYDGAWHA
jgi:hypothetical protein